MTPKDIKATQSSIASEVSKLNGIRDRLSEDVSKLDASTNVRELLDERPSSIGSHPAADDLREALVMIKAASRLLFDAMSKVS